MKVGEIWISKKSDLEVKIFKITKSGTEIFGHANEEPAILNDDLIMLQVTKSDEDSNIPFNLLVGFIFLMMKKNFLQTFKKVY